MKFTLLAISPAAALTLFLVLTGRWDTPNEATGFGALVVTGTWVITWGVLALYWAARIVRAALRSNRG